MLTLLLLLLLACGGPGNSGEVGELAPAWSEGLWMGRSLTVRAGLEEALAQVESGEVESGVELALQVYEGSFEPELEPAIRTVLGRRAAAQLAFQFGPMADALRANRGASAGVAGLLEVLDEAAARLDEQEVGIR